VPTWLAIILAVLSIPLIGTVVTLLWQRELEQRRLVGEASAVVTPVQELLRRLPFQPGAERQASASR
jgi:hypothetical protein